MGNKASKSKKKAKQSKSKQAESNPTQSKTQPHDILPDNDNETVECKDSVDIEPLNATYSDQDKNVGIGIIDRDTFNRILYFWFLTLFNMQQTTNMNIDDILIKLAYKYYFSVDTLLLKFYHYHVDDPEDDELSETSYLWLIHSNGNVYHIKDCHGIEDTIKSSSMDNEMNEIYLQKDKTLSLEQCDKLISILLELQINARRTTFLREYFSGGDVEQILDMIIHSGKEIAETHGVALKQYQNVEEINFDPLIDFLRNELNIDTKEFESYLSVKSLKDWMAQPHNQEWQRINICIDYDDNRLYFHKEGLYAEPIVHYIDGVTVFKHS